MFTFNGEAARALAGYGWFLVDNGYLVAWTENGAYMTVVKDDTATGFGDVGQPVPDGAVICMGDSTTLTAYDKAGGVVYSGPIQAARLAPMNWRRVALDRLGEAVPLHASFPPHGLPSVLGLDHDGPCALYLVGNEAKDKAILIRQSLRPEIMGIMAEMTYQGPDLPDWK